MVELGHQRLQLLRKLPRQLRGLPGAHSRQTGAQQLQRAQRQVQLQHHRQRQPQRQDGQRHAQQAGKALQRLGNQRLVARHHQAQGRGIVFGQLQRARHGQQGVALGAGQRQHLVALLGSLWRGHGHVKHLIPQRTRACQPWLGVGTQAVNLPVQARQGLLQAGIGLVLYAHTPAGQAVDAAAEGVELHHQLLLQLLGDVFAQQRAQAPARQQHAQQHPGQGARQQAQAQRVARPGAHTAALGSTSR